MILKIGDKELNIKFGYEPTLKSRIMSRLIKVENTEDTNRIEQAESLEDLLLFLPEFLLIGLQAKHEEYRYDYETEEGKDEQIDKMFLLIEEFLENEDEDPISLFKKLENEMLENGFLKKIFQKEKEKAKKESEKQVKKEN